MEKTKILLDVDINFADNGTIVKVVYNDLEKQENYADSYITEKLVFTKKGPLLKYLKQIISEEFE